MRRLILSALCLTALSACSNPQASKVTIPADIVQPCDPLPPFSGSTSDDLVTQYLRVVSLYKDCSTRHAGLS